MSSSVSRLERHAAENKKHPYSRLYSITLHSPRGTYLSLIKDTEWGFIFDGIMNPPLHNIFKEKDIYLEHTHTIEEVLAMSNDERALVLAQETFNSQDTFQLYCEENNIEIIDNYTVTANK
jgi:hypothetical protein